jgi:hypothetical protein
VHLPRKPTLATHESLSHPPDGVIAILVKLECCTVLARTFASDITDAVLQCAHNSLTIAKVFAWWEWGLYSKLDSIWKGQSKRVLSWSHHKIWILIATWMWISLASLCTKNFEIASMLYPDCIQKWPKIGAKHTIWKTGSFWAFNHIDRDTPSVWSPECKAWLDCQYNLGNCIYTFWAVYISYHIVWNSTQHISSHPLFNLDLLIHPHHALSTRS